MSKVVKVPILNIVDDFRELTPGDDLSELMKNISAIGMKQPIIIDDQGNLIDGLRRLRAAASLGWEEVPAVVTSTFDESMAVLAKTVKHGTLALAATPRRAWELFRDTYEQQKVRSTEMRKRRTGLPKNAPTMEPLPRSRSMLNEAMGFGPGEAMVASSTWLYKFIESNTNPQWTEQLAGIQRKLDAGGWTVYEARGAIDRLRKGDLSGDILSLNDQRDALASALSQLSGFAKAVTRIGEINPAMNQEELKLYIKGFEQGKRDLQRFVNSLRKRVTTP